MCSPSCQLSTCKRTASTFNPSVSSNAAAAVPASDRSGRVGSWVLRGTAGEGSCRQGQRLRGCRQRPPALLAALFHSPVVHRLPPGVADKLHIQAAEGAKVIDRRNCSNEGGLVEFHCI